MSRPPPPAPDRPLVGPLLAAPVDLGGDEAEAAAGTVRVSHVDSAMLRSGRLSLTLAVGFHPSPFGEAVIVAGKGGLAGLGFVDGDDRAAARADMAGRWPAAILHDDQAGTAALGALAFAPDAWSRHEPVPVMLIGTPFEIAVWEALLRIPLGRVTTYSALARHLGRPSAARAVGAAVGKNPVSAVVPCHRVVGGSGSLTGYYWGVGRKRAMLAWEAQRRAIRPRG